MFATRKELWLNEGTSRHRLRYGQLNTAILGKLRKGWSQNGN